MCKKIYYYIAIFRGKNKISESLFIIINNVFYAFRVKFKNIPLYHKLEQHYSKNLKFTQVVNVKKCFILASNHTDNQ